MDSTPTNHADSPFPPPTKLVRLLHKSAERAPSLRRNILYSGIGTFLRAGCQWLLLVFIARNSGPTHLGFFVLASSTIAPIFMLANLQLRTIQATDAGNRFYFPTVWTCRVATTALSVFGIAAYSIFFPSDTLYSSLLLALGLTSGIDALSDALHGRLQKQEMLGLVASSVSARGVLSLLLPTSALLLGADLAMASFLLPLASLIPLLFIDIPSLRNLPESTKLAMQVPSRDTLIPLLKSALPLGLSVMFLSLTLHIPRIVLAKEMGSEALGKLGALLQLVAAGGLVVSAGLQAAGPRMAKLYESRSLSKFLALTRRLHVGVIIITLGGFAISMLAGRKIVTLLFGESYSDASHLLPVLSIAGGFSFSGSVTGTALTAARLHQIQLPLAILTTISSYASSVLMIRFLGISGAAWSLAITYALKVSLGQFVLSRYLGRSATRS